jgi:hypothetical protein
MAWHFKTKREKLKKLLQAQQLACHFSGYNDKQELLMCMKAKQKLERKKMRLLWNFSEFYKNQ